MVGEAFARSASTPIDREVQSALPVLEGCFRAAVRAMRARLVTRTGRDLSVAMVESRLVTVTEVLESEIASANAVWCAFHLGRADLSGFVVMEGRLLSRLVGRLFGDGDVPAMAEVERALSEVELSVAARMCRELFSSVERFWPGPHPPRFFPGEVTVARQGAAELPPSAAMVAVEVRFGTDDAPLGLLQLVLPGTLAKGLAGKKAPAASRPEASRVLNFDRLMPVSVELVVELARVELTLQSLENLKVGADLNLNSVHEVCARVNDRASFFGEAGSVGGQRSFKIGRRAVADSTSGDNDR